MVLEVGATFPKCVLVTHMPPDRQQAPNPTYFCKRNVENPYRSPRGQRPARSVYGDAGTGTRKKRMPSRNRSDRGCDITSRESGQTSYGLSSRENLYNHHNGRKANECCIAGACTFQRGVGGHQLGRRPASGKKAADAYREGYTGWQTQQGESSAMATDPFVQRQSISCQTGD